MFLSPRPDRRRWTVLVRRPRPGHADVWDATERRLTRDCTVICERGRLSALDQSGQSVVAIERGRIARASRAGVCVAALGDDSRLTCFVLSDEVSAGRLERWMAGDRAGRRGP